MSKIANDGLTRSGTVCFTAVPIWQLATAGVKGLRCLCVRVKLRHASCNHPLNVHRVVDVHGALSRDVFVAFKPEEEIWQLVCHWTTHLN